MAALPNSPLLSLEEYLNTAYEPDVEFVDGVPVQRNAGDWLHALIQSNVLFALRRKYPHLSEGDVMSVVMKKLREYANKGVQNIWLVDPRLQLMSVYRPPTLVEL